MFLLDPTRMDAVPLNPEQRKRMMKAEQTAETIEKKSRTKMESRMKKRRKKKTMMTTTFSK